MLIVTVPVSYCFIHTFAFRHHVNSISSHQTMHKLDLYFFRGKNTNHFHVVHVIQYFGTNSYKQKYCVEKKHKEISQAWIMTKCCFNSKLHTITKSTVNNAYTFLAFLNETLGDLRRISFFTKSSSGIKILFLNIIDQSFCYCLMIQRWE